MVGMIDFDLYRQQQKHLDDMVDEDLGITGMNNKLDDEEYASLKQSRILEQERLEQERQQQERFKTGMAALESFDPVTELPVGLTDAERRFFTEKRKGDIMREYGITPEQVQAANAPLPPIPPPETAIKPPPPDPTGAPAGAGNPFGQYRGQLGQLGREYQRGLGAAAKSYELASDEEKQAYEEAAAALEQQREQEKDWDIARHHSLEIEKMDMQDSEQERQRLLGEEMSKLAALQEDFRNTKAERPSTANRLGYSLAGAMLAVASVRMGGDPAAGAKWLDTQINRDLARQQQVLNKKRASIQDQHNAVSMARAVYSDQRQADVAAYKMLLDEYDAELASMRSSAQNENQQKKIAVMQAGVDKLKAQKDAEFMKLANDGVLGVLDRQYNSAAQEMQLRMQAMKATGKPLSEKTIQDLTEAKEARDAVEKLRGEFSEKTGMFSILAKHIPGTPSSEYEAARKAFATKLIKVMSGAQVSEKEQERILGLIPEAQEWTSSRTDAVFDALRGVIADPAKKIKALGASGYDVSGIYRLQGPSTFRR